MVFSIHFEEQLCLSPTTPSNSTTRDNNNDVGAIPFFPQHSFTRPEYYKTKFAWERVEGALPLNFLFTKEAEAGMATKREADGQL